MKTRITRVLQKPEKITRLSKIHRITHNQRKFNKYLDRKMGIKSCKFKVQCVQDLTDVGQVIRCMTNLSASYTHLNG